MSWDKIKITACINAFADFLEEISLILNGDLKDELLNTPISELDLSVRTRRVLNAYNVIILRDLIHKTETEIYHMKNLGKTSLVEIKKKLDSLGLSLKK